MAPTKTPAMPQVTAYPSCSKCGAPYVLRRCFRICDEPSTEWLWQRDCKHKNAAPRIGEERK